MRSPVRLLLPALLAALLLGGCVQTPPFTVTPVVTGLERPWDVAWADGTMLFTERPGRLSAWVGGQKRLVAAPADVWLRGESGMLGLAVDPEFAVNRRVYVCLNSTASGAPDVRVVRWTINADFSGVTDRADVVTGMPVDTAGGNHSGCRPRFGPDGYLWVGTGDAFLGTAPQSPTSLGGKVLRVTRDGAPAPGNLGAPFDPRVFNHGHRNVQGLAFRPADGLGVTTEHGPGTDDELNRLVGGNFGWDPVPGYDQGVPMTDTAKFPGAVRPLRSSGSPTVAPSGATFVTGARWGTWDGKLAVTFLKRRALWIADLDSAGGVRDEGIALQDRGRLRSVAQGPDGDLYVTTDNGGGGDTILRLTPR